MPNRFAPGAQRAGWEAGIARANRIAAEVAAVIAELRAAGVTSKKGIAKALNKRAVRTPRGTGVELRRTDGRVLSSSTSLQMRPVVDHLINVPVDDGPRVKAKIASVRALNIRNTVFEVTAVEIAR
jgi:hypothetical protein